MASWTFSDKVDFLCRVAAHVGYITGKFPAVDCDESRGVAWIRIKSAAMMKGCDDFVTIELCGRVMSFRPLDGMAQSIKELSNEQIEKIASKDVIEAIGDEALLWIAAHQSYIADMIRGEVELRQEIRNRTNSGKI